MMTRATAWDTLPFRHPPPTHTQSKNAISTLFGEIECSTYFAIGDYVLACGRVHFPKIAP